MKKRLIGEMLENSAITLNTISQNRHQAMDCFHIGKTFDCDVIGIIKGAYEYDIDANKYIVKAGQLFFVPNGCHFSGRALEDSAHYFCHFTIDNLILTKAGVCQDMETVQLFIKSCKGDGDVFLLKCAIRVLLYHLAEMTKTTYMEEIPKGIKKAVEQINKNPRMNLTGMELAAIAGMNYSYFSRRFHEIMGISPLEYRDNIRLEEAKRLILQGLSVKETAEVMGFSDMFAFSKKFKKHFKISPSKFRSIDI